MLFDQYLRVKVFSFLYLPGIDFYLIKKKDRPWRRSLINSFKYFTSR